MTTCPAVPAPDVTGLTAFLRSQGFTTIVLPDGSQVIQDGLCAALSIVNCYINVVAPNLYNLAVYNLATDYIVNYAQDQPGQTFFQDLRTKFNIYGFVSGVISSSSDQGTANSLVVPDWATGLQLGDLQLLKTPWGRNYLAIAQKWGPDLFGIT